MRKYVTIFVALLTAFAVSTSIVGCGDDDDSPTNPGTGNNENLPLAMGNKWVMDLKDYTNDNLDSTYIDSMVIDTSFVRTGQTWYGQKGDDVYYRTGSEGAFQLIDMGGSFLEIKIMKPSAHVGEDWIEMVSNDTMKVEVLGVNESVTTPAGTFTGCHHYLMSFRGVTYTQEYWMKVGVGFVKMVNGNEFGGTRRRSEGLLKSYHIQ